MNQHDATPTSRWESTIRMAVTTFEKTSSRSMGSGRAVE